MREEGTTSWIKNSHAEMAFHGIHDSCRASGLLMRNARHHDIASGFEICVFESDLYRRELRTLMPEEIEKTV